MDSQKVIINGKTVHIEHVSVESVTDDMDIQIPTKWDKIIADYLGLREYVVYFWPDKDIPCIGHRIIVHTPDLAYMYVVQQKEAAQ